ncbi:MAG: sulfotransferase [Spirochaetales bacterium]
MPTTTNQLPDLRIIYISGRGHSGSTMLDAMLGNADEIESVGELISGMGRYNASCSCGEKFTRCPFWSETRRAFERIAGTSWDEAVRTTVGQAHISRFLATLVVSPSNPWVRRLKSHTLNIADALERSSGKSVFVDSSKEITRAAFLLRFVPGSVVIHLVRHPENVLQSISYRLRNGTGFKFLRMRITTQRNSAAFLFVVAAAWSVGNAMLEIVRLFGRKRFLRVRYEDVIASPEKALDRIENFAGVSLEEVRTRVAGMQPFDVGHNIGGNYMRKAGSFVLDPSKASREALPTRYRLMVHLLGWPLLWRYGYYRPISRGGANPLRRSKSPQTHV